MLLIKSLVSWVFQIYILLLLVRVIGSWFPSFASTKFMRFVCFYTDPYLNLFRRLIPPIGGTLDLSPMLAFFSLSLMEKFLTSLLK